MLSYLHDHLRFLLTEDLKIGQSVYESMCEHSLDSGLDSEAAAICSYLPCHVEVLWRHSSKIKQIRNWLGLILVNELANEHEALQKLPFLPDSLHKIAVQLEEYHPELAVRLRQIAHLKTRIINDEAIPPAETSLPYLAFPAVSRGPGARYVIWESFRSNGNAGNVQCLQPKRSIVTSFWHAVNMANKICGNITDWHLNLSEKIGLPISGASGSLALFAWLWLDSTGVELPCNIAITGKVGSNGEVEPVGELKLKIRIALSSGFNYVVVPRASLSSQAQEFEADLRVVAVDSVYDLISWFMLHDPISGARRKLFGFVQGGVAESQVNSSEFVSSLGKFVVKELVQGSWPEFCAQLACLSRSGKADYRRRSALNAILAASISKIIGKSKDERNKMRPLERRGWAQLFKSLVPESVYLLHLPIILERYKKNHSIAAFSLYHDLTARVFVQNLNISHAISWGDLLYKGQDSNNWFNRSLRKQFQLLSWYLFTDAFETLSYLVSWPKLTHMEEKWLAQLQSELVLSLKKAGLGQAALPDFNWAQLSKKVLSRVLSETFPEYFFNQGNVTSYNSIPIIIFQILSANQVCRLNYDTRILLRELACRILKRSFQGRPDLRLNKIVVEKLENDEKPEQSEIRQITHDGLLKCVRIILQSQEESNKFAGFESGGWIGSLCSAVKHRRGTNKVYTDIYELDHALNDGLIAMTRAEVCRHKTNMGQYDAFKFQCLVNPALALVSLVADLYENPGDFAALNMPELFGIWVKSIDESMNAQTGYRLLLAKEIMHWLAGMVVANSYLGSIDEQQRLDGRLSFTVGQLSKEFGRKIMVFGESHKEKFASSVRKRAFIDLLWLNLLDDRALQETLAHAVYERIVAKPDDSKNILLLAYVRGLWPECQIWHKLPSTLLAAAESLISQFSSQPDSMFNNRSIVQGLLPFIVAKRSERPDALVDMGNKLATSRGFSPLAFCLLSNAATAKKPLVEASWWELDWEREIYLSICAFRLFTNKDAQGLEKLSDNPCVDFKNMALICRLRKLLK